MADKDGEKKKTGGSSVAAFASAVDAQQKYIVFNLEALDYDIKKKPLGAGRFLPACASHELLHTLGFDHPINPAQPGEKTDMRTWEQIRQDITSRLSSETALGKLDKATGKRIITYSFTANPDRIELGGITVNGMRHLGDTKSEEKNKQNRMIRSAMEEAFAEQSSQMGIIFKEAKDPSAANILVFTGTIPSSSDSSIDLSGGKNPYTQDVTIMSYNQAVRGIFPMSAVGDTYAGQQIYGLPAKDPKRHTITAERLAHHSGVLWDDKPMAIKLTKSPMLGALTIDMGAHPYDPAITGTLKDKEGDKKVRQHIGAFASINELDARDSPIKLDVTGTLDAHITPNKGATVKLKGRNNDITLGAGADTVTFLKGFGNVIAGMKADDNIGAKEAKKVRLQYWNDKEIGTLITFIGADNKNKGSLFVKDATPEEVRKHFKDIALAEKQDKKPVITLDAIDKDSELKKPDAVHFHEAKDVVVSAHKAAGFGVGNLGGGCVVLKMTQPQYDSRTVALLEGGPSYKLSFRDTGGKETIHLQSTAKIAITGADGKIQRIVSIKESMKEFEMDLALRKGLKAESTDNSALAALPYNPKVREEQRG